MKLRDHLPLLPLAIVSAALLVATPEQVHADTLTISDSVDIDVSLTIEPTVSMTTVDRKLEMSKEGFAETDICVAATTRGYDLTMDTPAVMVGTSGDTIQMAVWYESGEDLSYEALTYAQPVTLDDHTFDCGNGLPTGKLVFQADTKTLYADTYTANLTFTVEPE